jgi:hypothetical protein
MDFSRDGKFLLYRENSVYGGTGWDIWALPLTDGAKPFPVVATSFEEREGQFSPDGQWIAYQSDKSGRFEIYVQRFPGPGADVLVSTNGGSQPRWSPDGLELFYIAYDGQLMSIPIRTRGGVFDASIPAPLFASRVETAVRGGLAQQYVVSPDGSRFLMNTLLEAAVSPITMLLNWNPHTEGAR